MLLALLLAIAPKIGAVVQKASEWVDRVEYVQGAFLTIMRNDRTALKIMQEDMELAVWVIEQRRRRRR